MKTTSSQVRAGERWYAGHGGNWVRAWCLIEVVGSILLTRTAAACCGSGSSSAHRCLRRGRLRCAALHSVLSSRRLGEVASDMTQARRRAFLRAARLAAPPSRTLARSHARSSRPPVLLPYAPNAPFAVWQNFAGHAGQRHPRVEIRSRDGLSAAGRRPRSKVTQARRATRHPDSAAVGDPLAPPLDRSPPASLPSSAAASPALARAPERTWHESHTRSSNVPWFHGSRIACACICSDTGAAGRKREGHGSHAARLARSSSSRVCRAEARRPFLRIPEPWRVMAAINT